MKIIANMRKAFGLALAFALALSLSAPAQGQSVLNQIGKRAKNAVNTRTTMGADRAIQKTLDKAENAIEKGVTNADTTPIQRQISCNIQNDNKTCVNANIYSI